MASGKHLKAVALVLALLIVPLAAKGYSLASIAHNDVNPSQQLVEFVKANYDPSRTTVCWDNQTHSFFDTIIPDLNTTGFWRVGDLYAAYDGGHRLLVTDRCVYFDELNSNLGLSEVARFQGTSPLWSKTPSITLHTTTGLP